MPSTSSQTDEEKTVASASEWQTLSSQLASLTFHDRLEISMRLAEKPIIVHPEHLTTKLVFLQKVENHWEVQIHERAATQPLASDEGTETNALSNIKQLGILFNKLWGGYSLHLKSLNEPQGPEALGKQTLEAMKLGNMPLIVKVNDIFRIHTYSVPDEFASCGFIDNPRKAIYNQFTFTQTVSRLYPIPQNVREDITRHEQHTTLWETVSEHHLPILHRVYSIVDRMLDESNATQITLIEVYSQLELCSNLFTIGRHITTDSENHCHKETSVEKGRLVSTYTFEKKEDAEKSELLWQRKTTERFFRVGKALKPGKESHTIYGHIIQHMNQRETTAININGFTRRSLIIALSKLLTNNQIMPALRFQLGITEITLEPEKEPWSRKRQQGNFKMSVPTNYPIAYGKGCIDRLTRTKRTAPKDESAENTIAREQHLLDLMGDRLPIIKPFTYQDFNEHGQVFIPQDTQHADPNDSDIKDHIHFLNGLLFLTTTVEVLVRLYRDSKGNLFDYEDDAARESDSLPIAIAQTRSLFLLLINRSIPLSDFWGESKKDGYDEKQHRAYFGLVTGKGTINHLDIMLEKLTAINAEYNKAQASQSNRAKEQALPEHRIEGRSFMACRLKAAYGSGDESDAESSDYSNDEFDTTTLKHLPSKKC